MCECSMIFEDENNLIKYLDNKNKIYKHSLIIHAYRSHQEFP